MTGLITFTPEAQQQLHALDDWITEKASRDVAQRFVAAVLEFIDDILIFPTLAESAMTSDRECGRPASRSGR